MNPERERQLASKIQQMLPADGWRAVYSGEGGKPWADPLVCWALVCTPDRNDEGHDFGEALPWSQQAIVGFVADSDGDISPAVGSASFIGYAAASDLLETFEEKAAEKHAEMVKKGWRS